MKILTKVLTAAAFAAVSNLALADVVSDIGSVATPDPAKTENDWNGMVGLVALSAPEYQGSEDSEGSAAPILIVDYKDTAYFKVNRGGYWFWKPNENFRMGALVKLRAAAWEDDDDSIEDLGPLPDSFDEPDGQAEAGVNFLYKKDRFQTELQLTSGEDINLALTLNYNIIQSKKLVLVAQLGLESLGEDTVLYNWYGDDDDTYDVDGETTTSLALVAIQSLGSSDWKLLYGVKSTSYGDEIDDSPIVEDDTYAVGFFGGAISF